MTLVEHTTSWGERVKLAICMDTYYQGGALALLALNVTDPGNEDEYLEFWDVLTVNLPSEPVAKAWCSQSGHVVVDTNNVSSSLMDALERAGIIELSGGFVRSGLCSYPLASISSDALRRLAGYEETVRALSMP